MPAIVSLNDLKAAQKPLRYALCSLLYASWEWRRIGWKNVCGASLEKDRAVQRLDGGDIPASGKWASLCRGKLWLQERTPEELKGEGE